MTIPVPRPIVGIHGEDVDVEVPGRVTLRATFLSEGLFDERGGGNPDEEDLFEVEVTHPEGELLEPIVFPRLLPAAAVSYGSSWIEEEEEPRGPGGDPPAARFLLALAWELAQAHPSNWTAVCEAARGWDAWTIEDALIRMPPEWTPETLLPDLD